MRLNSPDIFLHSYIGLTPLTIAHSLSKNVFHHSRFFNLQGVHLPGHQRFWSKFEIDIINLFAENFEFENESKKILLSVNGFIICLGQSVELNFLELRRKFPILENKILDINGSPDLYYQKIEEDIFSIWLKISKHSNYQSVNFQSILKEFDNPILHILFDWLKNAFTADESSIERDLIRLLSQIFLGVEFSEFCEMQLFYLLSKLITPNYFICDYSTLENKFHLNKNIASPLFIQTNKFVPETCDDFPANCICSDGYFGKTFSGNIYSNCFKIRPCIDIQFDNKIMDYSYTHIMAQLKSMNHEIDFVEIVFDNKMLSIAYKDLVETYSFETLDEHFNHKNLSNNNLFYILKPKSLKPLTLVKWSKATLEIIDCRGSVAFNTGLLNDSHYLGNISALFYGN